MLCLDRNLLTNSEVIFVKVKSIFFFCSTLILGKIRHELCTITQPTFLSLFDTHVVHILFSNRKAILFS